MKLVLALFAILFSSYTPSYAEDWFARPCAHNGDGKSSVCASSAGQAGAFNSTSSINWTKGTGVDEGDTLYICGEHRRSLRIPSGVSGTASNKIKISFSCPGVPGRITQQTIHRDALDEANWIQQTPNIWYFSTSTFPNPPVRLWLNLYEQVPSENKDYLGTQASATGPFRSWWYNHTEKRIYLFARSNPATVIQDMRTLAATNDDCTYGGVCFNGTNQHIDVINPDIQGGSLGSVYIAGSSYLRIYGEDAAHCRIGALSSRGVFIGDSALNGTGVPAHHIELFNCTLDPAVPPSYDGYTFERNGVSGDGIALLQGANDNYFHDLVLKNWQHAMVNIVGDRGTATLQRNIFEYIEYDCDVFVEYCRAFAIDGNTLGRVSENIFRNSLIKNMTVRSQFNGDHNVVENNYFQHHRLGTIERSPLAQVLESQGYAGPSQDNVIRQNVFYGNFTGPCISFRPSTAIVNTVVEGNVFVNCGGVDGEYTALYIPNVPNMGPTIVRGNTFIGISPIWYRTLGKTTVASMQTSCSTGDVCTDNREFPSLEFSLSLSGECGFHFLWEMGGGRARSYICLR